MIWAGIDPGSTGALAVILPDGTVKLIDTPIIETKVSGKKRKEYDDAEMARLLRRLRELGQEHGVRVHVTLEKVNAMPSIDGKRSMGATSAFSFGTGYGVWRGALAALQVPFELVAPQRWKKHMLPDTAKDDGAVAAIASRLFPAAAGRMRGPKGGIKIGRVDALLLAAYGRHSRSLPGVG